MSQFQKNIFDLRVITVIVIGLLYKILLSYSLFGGGDATNVQSFYLIADSGINIYERRSPWPYFPITVNFLKYVGELFEAISFDVQHAYRLTLSLADLLIGYFIFKMMLSVGYDYKQSFLALCVYTFNPLSVLIVSVLGFIDSACLLIMLIISFLIFKTSSLKINMVLPLICFLLAMAVSFKPMAIILLPYVMYKTSRPLISLLLFLIFIHILNLFYILEYGYISFLSIVDIVFIKITSGHQLSSLALGSFSNHIPFFYLKLITVFGIIFTAFIALNALRVDAFAYCGSVFLAILIFRYNAHPQYFLWPLPFLFLSHSVFLAWFYSIVCSVAIALNLTIWHSNSSAYSFLSALELSTFSQFEQNISNQYGDSKIRYMIQIILIALMLYLLGFRQIYGAFKSVLLYFFEITRSLSIARLSIQLVPCVVMLALASDYLVSEDFLSALKFIVVVYLPILLSCILSSSGIFDTMRTLHYIMYSTTILANLAYKIYWTESPGLLWVGAGFFVVLLVSIRSVFEKLDSRILQVRKQF